MDYVSFSIIFSRKWFEQYNLQIGIQSLIVEDLTIYDL